MLTALTLEGFKSHRSSTLHLSDLTVLIGAHASGKSNALEALELLTWIARGRHLSELPHALRAGELRIRGDVQDFAPRDAPNTPLVLRATFEEPGPGAWEPELRVLLLTITLAVDGGDLRIVEESLRAPHRPGGMPLYSVGHAATGGGSTLDVRFDANTGVNGPSVQTTDQQAVFTQLPTAAGLLSGLPPGTANRISAACEHVRRALRSTVFLDPVPARMRGSSDPGQVAMQRDGGNLASVLDALFEDLQIEHVLAFVEGLPEEEIVALGVVDGPQGEVRVEVYETFGETPTPVEATLLGDGTLRVLAVAATLLSAPAGSLVVLGALDSSVHPSRTEALVRRIEDTAKARRLRVLVPTHDARVMDALSDDATDHAVVCYRAPSSGASALVRLKDLARYAALVAEGPLGRLVTKGALQRHLPGFQREEPDAVAFLRDLPRET